MTASYRPFAPVFLVVMIWFLPVAPVSAEELTLAVANSTCNAVKKVGALYMRQQDAGITYLCKSSGRLAKGLRGGAIDADIYISASRSWMDFMVDAGMMLSDHVVSPWGNKLVVAAPMDGGLELSKWDELATDKVRTVLIGDPGTAPFGRYAKQALQATGLWKRVRKKIETRKHITLLAETLSKSDASTVGILFVSNVIPGKLRTLLSVDKSWHKPIRYYMAPVRDAAGRAQVVDLLKFIQGPAAQQIFSTEGFETMAP